MKRGLVAVAVLLLFCTTATQAQHHAVSNVQEINGQEHPEQIPDTIAYLNFFRAHSVGAKATEDEVLQQGFKISRMHLGVTDEAQFRSEMLSFRTKFDKWNASYSAMAEKGLVQPTVFWAGVAKIIAETRGNLQKGLGSQAHKQYEDGVQGLREHTRYFTSTGGVL